MSNKLSMRVATHALIAALTITTGGIGAVTLATPAVAVDADNNYTPKIDTSRKGKLIIHKKANPEGSLGAPTGKETANVSGADLGGVTFKLQKLNYDITKTADLKQAEAVNPNLDPITPAQAELPENQGSKAPVLADPAVTKTETTKTNPESEIGKAEFVDLDLGVYLVTEAEAPAGYQKSAPFMVFIPMTDQDPQDPNQPWLYNVVAYPKNTTFSVKKAFTDAQENKEANVGDDVSYVITGDRPTFDKKKRYVNFYQLIDNVPAGLSYKSVSNVEIQKDGETISSLSEPGDYTVVGKDTNSVKVQLTNAGLQKLLDADEGSEVKATFTFDVVGVTKNEKPAAFQAVNEGSAAFNTKPYKNPPADPDSPKVPDNNQPEDPHGPAVTPGDNPDVSATWIPVVIKKTDATDGTALEGAEFQVYRCVAKNENAKTGKTIGDPLSLKNSNEDKKFVTDAEGKVTLDALRLRDKREEGENEEKQYLGYCLVETKAPKGITTSDGIKNYELLPEPFFFRLPEPTDAANPVVLDLPVENVRAVGPKLPATGGMGVGILVAIGALITGAGAFFARRNTKKA